MTIPSQDLGGLSPHPNPNTKTALRSESPSATEVDLGWVPCPVPECIEGKIRVPHKTYAGEPAGDSHYVQMLEVRCYECRGQGLVSGAASNTALGTLPPDTTQEDR